MEIMAWVMYVHQKCNLISHTKTEGGKKKEKYVLLLKMPDFCGLVSDVLCGFLRKVVGKASFKTKGRTPTKERERER